jgi:hypothetical protein
VGTHPAFTGWFVCLHALVTPIFVDDKNNNCTILLESQNKRKIRRRAREREREREYERGCVGEREQGLNGQSVYVWERS